MIETSIIVFGVVVSLLILSKADIKITIVHKEEDPKLILPKAKFMTQEELDARVDKQEPQPTFDDVVAAVHDILGGEEDD